MESKKLIPIPVIFIVSSFLIESIEKYISFLNKSVAFYFFWIGIGVGSLLILLELYAIIHVFIEKHFLTLSKKVNEYNAKLENEQNKIKELLNFCGDEHSIKDVIEHYYKMNNANFSKEALAHFIIEWHEQVDALHELIINDEKAKLLRESNQEKIELQNEIDKLRKEKEFLESSEDEQLLSEKEDFLSEHKYKINIESEDLTNEQRSWLEEIGFKKSYQWDINSKETTEFMIKPRHNESLSHAYLVGALFDHLKNEVETIETPITKTADIIFRYVGTKFAIEVETGTVLEKSKKQLKNKVENLNKEFGNCWFFVVTNKNLISKYKKYGTVVDRSNVIEHLDSILKSE